MLLPYLSRHTHRSDAVPLLLTGTTTPAQRFTLSSPSCFHNNHCHLDDLRAPSSPSPRGVERSGRTGGRGTFHVGPSRPASSAPGMSGSAPTQVPTSTAAAEALLSRHASLARPTCPHARRPRPLARPQPLASYHPQNTFCPAWTLPDFALNKPLLTNVCKRSLFLCIIFS